MQVEAVMRRILWLLRDATAKMLVFSTWVDVIDLMAHALRTNGVRFAYPRSQAKFSRELAAFRSSIAATQQPGAPGVDPRAADAKPLQVLLLLVKQGANGLNLTEAQHVILVEPLMDPAVEAQAIGRVDRLGQTRETTVHRFVVESSVEENVHQLCSSRAAAMDLSAAGVGKRSKGEEKMLSVRDVAVLLSTQRWSGGDTAEARDQNGPAEDDDAGHAVA